MKVEYYIDKLKAIDVYRLKPLEAYEQVLGVIFKYSEDTDDDCFRYCSKGYECIAIPEDIPGILKEDGWKTVWEFLRHIPEESVNDNYFMMENYYLRPIRTEDAVRLRNEVLGILQDKLRTPEDKLIQDLRNLGEITPYNRQFYEMQTLVQEYARDTGDSEIKEYLKRYAGHLEVRKVLQGITYNVSNSREAVIYAKEFLDSLDLTAEVFHEDDNLEPATTEGLDALRDEIIAYLLKKEKKNEA